MKPVPAFALHALGRRVRVLREPGVPEEFVARLRSSWADCLLPQGPAASDAEPTDAEPSDVAPTDADPDDAALHDASAQAGPPVLEDAPAVVVLLVAADSADAGPDGGADPGTGTAALRPASGDESPLPAGVPRIPVGGREDWDHASQLFVSEVTVALIGAHLAEESPDRAHLLHAAALMDPDTGATAVLVGPSGRGKTTAARALGRAGLVYLSDETSAIHPRTLRLTPYPKPLSVLREPGRPKEQIAASALGLPLPQDYPAPHLAALVVLDRAQEEPDAGQLPRASPMPLHLGLQVLAEQSSGTTRRPDGLERLADLAERAGGILTVRYREAHTLAPLVRELLARTQTQTQRAERREERTVAVETSQTGTSAEQAGPRPERSWTYHPPAQPAADASAAESRPAQPSGEVPSSEMPESEAARNPAASSTPAEGAAPAPGTRWQRDPEAAAVDTADGMILMRGDRSFTVSRVAADAWLRAADPVDSATLEHHLESLHGGAPEGALQALLETLARERLLRLVPSAPPGSTASSPPAQGETPAHRSAPAPAEKDR